MGTICCNENLPWMDTTDIHCNHMLTLLSGTRWIFRWNLNTQIFLLNQRFENVLGRFSEVQCLHWTPVTHWYYYFNRFVFNIKKKENMLFPLTIETRRGRPCWKQTRHRLTLPHCHKRKEKKKKNAPDTWHVTPNMWHLTPDMWHIVWGKQTLKILGYLVVCSFTNHWS